MALDEMQMQVAQAPWNEKLVVHAGPGSGKTLTLIERLKFLMSSGLQAGEVLVVSFSVAAKEELEKRIKHSDENEDIRFIHPRTLDKLATQIIYETCGSCSGAFLHRINQAEEIVRKSNPNPPSALDGIKHILVDEAQDIVGSRAQFLFGILSRISETSGFTVFADVAQSIYDFQIREGAEDEGGLTSFKMIELIESLGASSVRLENYYRSDVPFIKDICRIPWLLLLDVEKRAQAFEDLLLRVKAVPSIGALNPGIRVKELTGKSKALLCRTNYQVIATAESLRKYAPSVDFVISRSERIPRRPYWVSRLLRGLKANTLLNDESLGVRFSQLGECDETLDGLLLYLKRQLGLKKRDGLYVHHLIEALNDELSLKDVMPQPCDRLVLSTIHASKGREYDSVAIYFEYDEGRLREMLKQNKAEHACRLFVAMSRPRHQLVRYVAGSKKSDVDRMKHMKMLHSHSSNGEKRAVQIVYRHKVGQTIAMFQVGLPGDVMASSFVKKPYDLICHEQDVVLPGLNRGNEVTLRAHADELYHIYVDGYNRPLGSMSREFTAALRYSLRQTQDVYYGQLPVELRGAWIRGLASASSVPGDTDGISREILESGIWGCLELEGWASLVWN